MEDRRPFVPASIKAAATGTRPSVAPLLALVDTTDPAFPFVAAELKTMSAAGVDLNEVTVDAAIKVGRCKHETSLRQRRTAPERVEIVYYIRRSDLVKIGTTANPADRISGLMPDEILAFEPGGRELEQLRHKQFHPERVTMRGEYFRVSPRLQKHIAAVREQHGAPSEDWVSITTLGRGYRRGREVIDLPDPVSGEVLTAVEASKRFGMRVSTPRQWARRGRIVAAGTNAKGRPVYHLEHLQYLIERGRKLSPRWYR